MKRYRAFTMIELLIVIGLASIVFMIGIPNYNRFRQNQAAASAAMQFIFDVRNVRQKCINLEQEVIFTINDISTNPANQYSFPMPGDTKTIVRRLTNQYPGAIIDGWGGSTFKITQGGQFNRDSTDAMVPNPDPGGQNYMGVAISGGAPFYVIKLLMNGETVLEPHN